MITHGVDIGDLVERHDASRTTGTIGSIILIVIDRGERIVCDGRFLKKTSHPKLFARIGYRFGCAGDSFAIPDLTGSIKT